MSGIWNDWQFWVVTAAAAGGLFVLIRPLLRKRAGAPAAGCGRCDACPSPPAPPPLVKLGAGRRE